MSLIFAIALWVVGAAREDQANRGWFGLWAGGKNLVVCGNLGPKSFCRHPEIAGGFHFVGVLSHECSTASSS